MGLWDKIPGPPFRDLQLLPILLVDTWFGHGGDFSVAAGKHRMLSGGNLKYFEVDWAGENIWLLPQRAAFWPRKRILLIADVHWGKGTSFRTQSIAVPQGSEAGDLHRLDDLLRFTNPTELVILGDLIHARSGLSSEACSHFAAWRSQWPELRILLVMGNHDRHFFPKSAREVREAPQGDSRLESSRLLDLWRIEVTAELQVPPFVMIHEPAIRTEGFVLAGHLHPTHILRDTGCQPLKLHCWSVSPNCAIFPAFGSFIDGRQTPVESGDELFLIAGDTILPHLPKLSGKR